MKFSGLHIFLICFFSGVAIASPSELLGQEILEKRLTLNADNQKIKNVLTDIEKSVRIKFSYNPQSISVDKKVTFDYQNRKLGDILEEVLSGANLTFEVVGNYIIIIEKSSEIDQSSNFTPESNAFTVSGTVKDEQGDPLPGVNIIVKQTTNGTTTDARGAYSLIVSEGTETLVFSFIGYAPQEVAINNRSVVDVVMIPDIKSLQEVVVIGYGTVEKKDLTGSVGSLEADVISQTTITDAAGAIQGRVAGVNIERNVGRPGGGFQITVRGLGSINNADNSNNPLYVIDGIPTTEGLTDLNPNDIESIDILKDASATAIYGSRGANGVVVVTTKKGKSGKFSIQYDGNYGVRTPSNLPDMMNGDQYVQWRTDLFTKQGKSTDRSNAEFFTPEEWALIDNGQYTDWVDLILRTGIQTSNTITASGGDEKGTFALSIGQLKEEGTVSGQDFNRYNIRLNLNRKFLDKWEAGGNMYFARSIQNEGSYETLRSAYRMPPVATPYDSNGKPKFFSWRNDFTTNPLFEFERDGEIRENKRSRFFGNVYLQVQPIEGLTLRSQLSPQLVFRRDGEYYGQFSKAGAGKIGNTIAYYETEEYFGYVLDNQVNYTKQVAEHNFNATLVHSIQLEEWESTGQNSKNFPYNSQWFNLDAVSRENINSSQTNYRKRTLASVLARLQYDYKDKYLLTVSGRYDGSSRLAEGNKWAFFPSAAVAWRISQENFLQGFEGLNNLKLRLSYGVSGNDAVDIYGTQSNVSQKFYDFNGVAAPAYYKNQLSNSELTWEKTTEIDIGIDFGFLNDRISGSIDLYRQDSKDLIMRRQLPETAGWPDIWDNVGWVRNSGIEFALNTFNVQKGNFSWSTGLVFDANKNEIIELYGAKKDDVGNRWFIGEPIQVNYDYEFDGIWQSSESDLATKYGQTPGQIRVKDQDSDGDIDANDRKVIGQRTPKWSGSITNTLKYKNWDFSVYVYTRQGQQLSSTFVSTFMGLEGNYNNVAVDYWTESNSSNEYPQPGNRGRFFNTYQYRDVSFVRIGNISLGYSLSEEILSKLRMQKLRIYATAMNPFTFTKYPGYDPEWADQNTWGEATGFSTYLLGVNVAF
jgi:TonB-linked SusC/RagA family outer membrane protein